MQSLQLSPSASLDCPALNQYLTVGTKSILARDAIRAVLENLSDQVSSDSYEISWGDKNSYKNIDIRVELKSHDEIDLCTLAGKVESVIQSAFSSVFETDPYTQMSSEDFSRADMEGSTLCKCSLKSSETQGPSLTISIDSLESKKHYVLHQIRKLSSNPSKEEVLRIPELISLMLRLFPGDFPVINDFFHQIGQLVLSLPALEEKTKISCGSMKRFFAIYKDRLEEIPPYLWEQLRSVASLSITPESKGRPWKDLTMSLCKDFPPSLPIQARVFLDVLFHLVPESPGLFESDEEKWIYHLHALAYTDTPPKLIRNQSPSLLAVLKNIGIQERKEWIQKCFKDRGIQDPFNFRNNLRFLLTSQERTLMIDSDMSDEFLRLAWNLVACQKDLWGFTSILSDCQEIFHSHGSQKARKQYVEFFKKSLSEEKDEQTLAQLALRSYAYLFHNQELSEFVEEMFFLDANRSLTLKNFAKENTQLSTAFQQALAQRIGHRIKEGISKIRPPFICTLIRNLFALSNNRSDVVGNIGALLVACNEDPKKMHRAVLEVLRSFPDFLPEILEKIRGTSCEKNVIILLSQMRDSLPIAVQRACFTQLVGFLDSDIKVESALRDFFEVTTDKEKVLLIRKYAELRANRAYLKTSEDLFIKAVQSIVSWTEAFQDLGKTLFLLEQYFDLFQKTRVLTQEHAEAIFAKIPRKDFFVSPTSFFMEKILPYLTDRSREIYFEENMSQITDMIALKRPIQEIFSYMFFLLKDGGMSSFFEREGLSKIGAFYISFFTQHLERIYPLFTKNHREATLLVRYVQKYLSVVATDEERSALVYKSATCRSKFIHKAIEDLSDFSFLNRYPWTDQDIEEGFLLLKSNPQIAQKYVDFALDNLKQPRMHILKEMVLFLTPHSKDRMIGEMLKWAHQVPVSENKKLWLEDYLSALIVLEPYFSQNRALYEVFLQASYKYMALTGEFKQEKEIFEKIEEILVKDLDSGQEDPQNEKILQKLIIFAGITAFPRRPEFAISVIRDCSSALLRVFSQEMRSWSVKNRTLFLQGLLAKFEKVGQDELLLQVWKDHWDSLRREDPRELEHIEPILIKWGELVLKLEPPFSRTMSETVDSFRKNLSRNFSIRRGKELAFKLLKHVHCERLKTEPPENTHLDRMAYYEFLRDVEIEEGKTLEAYIKENGLFLGTGNLRKLVRIYDEVLSQDLYIQRMYNKMNLIRDLEVLDRIDKKVPETSPEMILLSIYLGIRVGKHGMENILGLFSKLVSRFDRDTLRIIRVFQGFYQFAWADFRLLCEKNNALMNFCEPIVSTTSQLLRESLEEYKTIQDIQEEQVPALIEFFYALYAMYVAGLFEELAFSIGRSFDAKAFLVDMAVKLSEKNTSFLDKLITYAEIEQDELNEQSMTSEGRNNYKNYRLQFFTDLLEILPEHRRDLRAPLQVHIRKLSRDLSAVRK